MEFYSAAAQLIPILFLALIVERRFFEDAADESPDPMLDLLVMGLFIFGETAALATIGGVDVGRASRAFVAVPIAIGALAIVSPAAWPRLRHSYASASGRRRVFDRLLVIVLGAMIYVPPLAAVLYAPVIAFR